MMTERRELGERLAHAFHSSNLAHKEGACDTDKLAAVGMTSCHEAIVSHLFRVKFDNDPRAFRPALERLMQVAKGMDIRYRWRATQLERNLLARAVLKHWVNSKCHVCTGLGFLKALDAPTLVKRCPACQGSGDASLVLPRALPHSRWDSRATDLLHWVYDCETRAGFDVIRRLRST